MRYKNIFTLLVILSLIILIIPTFYATDNENKNDETITNTISNSIDNTIESIKKYIGLEKEDEDATDVHSYDELANFIENKTKEKTKKTYAINLQDGDYNITKTITCGNTKYTSFKINGNGHTIDGNGKKQFMNVYGDLKIKDLTIQNTKYQKNESGAICMVTNAKLEIENCTFKNNHGNIKGGAITSRGNTTINNTVFINNTCELTGGAIWSTGEHGGTLTLKNSTFKQNIANSKLDHERTSVVYMVSPGNNTVENNVFENNTGRCLHSFMNTSTKIINNTFKNNNLTFNEVIRGGIIDNYESDITIENNVFINDNTNGELRGGLLYHEIGYLKFNNNTINDKHTQTGHITNTTCSKGGLIFNRNATVEIKDNNFNNTVNANLTWGGVIYNNAGNITLGNNKFTNTVNGEHIKGMAIYNDVNAKTIVSNDKFETKYNGSIDTEKQKDEYIYNSDVPNTEGNGKIGITKYEDVS
ncbi:MAG: right-handed parallel beta-helix repeat-containing protein [Methanosphaera sp.]|nr:right-handed parallel beta-helix repeat-containing protein [Methanosphaera sp.]